MISILKAQEHPQGSSRGPNDFKYENGHCLQEVHFSGTTNTNYIEIRKDDDSDIYYAPHFVKEYPNDCEIGQTGNVIAKKPVGYVSGTKARVKAKFISYCSKPYWMRGVGPKINGTDIIFEKQEVTPSNFEVIYNWTDANIDFPALTVRYFEKFTIKWQISKDGLGNWIDIGESENPLYVTHKEPATNNTFIPTIKFETLLHIGCKNGNLENIETSIVDKIYNDGFKFSSGGQNKVYRIDGAGPITYWTGNNCQNPKEMLVQLTGACGGWALFFEDILRIQGISNSQVSVVEYFNGVLDQTNYAAIEADVMNFFGNQATNVLILDNNDLGNGYPPGYTAQFFVKNWNVSATTKFTQNEWHNPNLLNPPVTPVELTLTNGNKVKILEQSGAAGQGNPDPRSEFENHAIVKYNGKYYDPSYGSAIATSANNWETPALSFFGSMVYFEPSPGMFYLLNWVGHLNTSSQQATITP